MRGILFSQMEPPQELEAEFHDWYEHEHVPVRLAVDGFEAASRWEAVEGSPRWLAIYELRDLAVLQGEAYRRVKEQPSLRTSRMLAQVRGFTRFTCEELSDTGVAATPARWLSVVAFQVPPEEVPALDEWYEREHVGLLMRAPDWLRVRRFQVRSGEGAPWTHLAIHELANREVMEGPERAAARHGPMRSALSSRPWFQHSGRWLYRLRRRYRR